MAKNINPLKRAEGAAFMHGMIDALISRLFGWPFLIILAIAWFLTSWLRPIDTTDEGPFDRSGMHLFRDAATGVEYLAAPGGGIIVRQPKPEDVQP